MWGMSDDPILTYAQVKGWQERQAEIARSIQSLQDESNTLSRKLDAVRVIMGELPLLQLASLQSEAETARNDVEEGGQRQTIMLAVKLAVRSLGAGATPHNIRTWLRQNAPSEEMRATADKPYFYTVLNRLTASGQLTKEGDRYRFLTDSPQGDTGGVVPSGDSPSTDKLSVEAGETARKEGGI